MKEFFKLKCDLLTMGCGLDDNCITPSNIQHKEIHLYSHSLEKPSVKLPEDFFIGKGDSRFNIRLRLNRSSPFRIFQKGNQFLLKKNEEVISEIEFANNPKFRDHFYGQIPISSVCTRLGDDTLGVIPSNYCFYFKDGKQCRFCEILPTHKKEVEYSSTLKPIETIANSLKTSLETDPYIKHIAITSGNVKSYDWTVEYFCKIGESLQENGTLAKIQDFNATLMPPDDFSLIEKLRVSGFNKVYFPIEVYDKKKFSIVCPGKEEYGYERIIDALCYAVKVFGEGNVYTNLVYGIQSLNDRLEFNSYDPKKENELCLKAVNGLIKKRIIPLFTIYHYGGYNSIGTIELDPEAVFAFFQDWGKAVYGAKLIHKNRDSVLFDRWSLSNSLFNDGFWLAKKEFSDDHL